MRGKMYLKNVEVVLEYSAFDLAERGVWYLIGNAFSHASVDETAWHSWVVQTSGEQTVSADIINKIPSEGLLYVKIQGAYEENPHEL